MLEAEFLNFVGVCFQLLRVDLWVRTLAVEIAVKPDGNELRVRDLVFDELVAGHRGKIEHDLSSRSVGCGERERKSSNRYDASRHWLILHTDCLASA